MSGLVPARNVAVICTWPVEPVVEEKYTAVDAGELLLDDLRYGVLCGFRRCTGVRRLNDHPWRAMLGYCSTGN